MKRTYQPNKRKKAKKHGFFARIKGKVLNKRRAKQRKKLCASATNKWFFVLLKKHNITIIL